MTKTTISKQITKNTPLVFLDYDGVLQYISPFQQMEPNEEAVDNIIRLCLDADAKIIWITDRLRYDYFLPKATWFGNLVQGMCDPWYSKSDRLDIWIEKAGFIPNRFCVIDDSYKFQEHWEDIHVWVNPEELFISEKYYEWAYELL